MLRLFIKDNVTGNVHEYGTDPHDALYVNKNGSLHYENLATLCGTKSQKTGYTFVFTNGSDPRESTMVKKYKERAYIDIGGTEEHRSFDDLIGNIEIMPDTSWMAKVAKDVEPTRAERVFGD